MENNKKYKILGIVIVVILVVLFLYLGLFNKKVFGPTSVSNKNEQGKSLPSNVMEEFKGANPISEEGVVVTPEGKPADNTATPGSPEAPSQSAPISKEEVPASAIKLEVSFEKGFSPNTFTVKANAPVTLSLTGLDDRVHVLRFNNPALNAIAIGLGPRMTRMINFNAPKEPGEYTFFDDVPGQQNITGKMIVK